MNPILKALRGAVAAIVIAGIMQSVGSIALAPPAHASNSQLTATTSVNIRAAASASSARVGILYAGDRVQTISSSNGWTAINHKGKTAYVATAYLSTSSATEQKPPSSAGTGDVYSIANLNLRAGPSLSHPVARVVTKGAKLSLTGSVTGTYSQVRYAGKTFWAATAYLSTRPGAPTQSLPATTGKVRATAVLMIRTTSDKNFVSLGEVATGTILNVSGVLKNGLAQVVWQGRVAWVNNSYVTLVSGSASRPVAPPSTGQGGGSGSEGSLNKGHSSGLDQTNANTKMVVRHIWANYPSITTMYGWRRDVTPDHPAGRAVDVMIPNYKSNSALGTEISRYFRANAKQFNISYVIFNGHIWSAARDKEGWRKMADRGGDTANHKDHVHINTYDA